MVMMKTGLGPLTAIRLTSFVAGLVTLVVVGVLGRRVGGTRVAWTAAALFAASPLYVLHDSLGFYEATVGMLAALALLLQVRLAERPALATAMLLGLVLGAGLLAKVSARFAVVLIPLALLCFHWDLPHRARRLVAWAGGVAIALLLAYVCFSVLKLSDLYDDYVQQRD